MLDDRSSLLVLSDLLADEARQNGYLRAEIAGLKTRIAELTPPPVYCRHCGAAIVRTRQRWEWEATEGSAIYCLSRDRGDGYHRPPKQQ